MKLIDLYTDYFANWISSGNLVNSSNISLLGLKPLFDRYLTNKTINKTWCIQGLPVYCKSNVTQAIRQEMFKSHPKVRTVISTYSIPTNPDVHSDSFRRHLKSTADSYNRYKSVFEHMEDNAQITGDYFLDGAGHKIYINKETLESLKKLYDSYIYVYDKASKGEMFADTYYFIQASAQSRKEMRIYRKELNSLLMGEGIQFVEVKGNVSKYLSNYAPAAYKQEEVPKISSILTSEENLASLMPYKTKGLISDSGILLGEDITTHLPFWLNFTASGSAQVVLFLAESGWGKTNNAFNSALQFNGVGIHWSAIDIKGNEWYKLLQYTKGVVISMDDVHAQFVNTLRLDDLQCTEEDAAETFNVALRDTVMFYTILLNLAPNEGNETDLDMLLNLAVMKMYNKRNVIKNNPATFVRTKDMKYAEIIDIMDSVSASHSLTDEQRKMCTLIKTRLANYFLAEGRFSEVFKNEITVADVIDAPGVIYSFNKNSTTMLDTLDTLRVFMVQVLDGRKTILRKRKKLATVAYYEELARCEQFGKLLQYISHRVTGSRSDNLIIFLLLNAISAFNNKDMQAIRSNVTTKIIGKIQASDVQTLVNDFGCSGIQNYLEILGDDAQSEKYRNCFAVQYDTGNDSGKGMYKVILPADMQKSLATRDFETVSF